MPNAFAVVSAIGTDRIGIVDALTGQLLEVGGSIKESRMAVLGGEFAVVMLIGLPNDKLEDLIDSVPDMEAALRLKIWIKPTSEGNYYLNTRVFCLEAMSIDGLGILHTIGALMHKHGINIENMETGIKRAPLTGSPLFKLKATLTAGKKVNIADFKADLDGLDPARFLEITLNELDEDTV